MSPKLDSRGWRIPKGKISRAVYDGLSCGLSIQEIHKKLREDDPSVTSSLQTLRILAIKIQGPKNPRVKRDSRGWIVPRPGSIARVVYDGMVRDASYAEIIADAVAAFPGKSVTKRTINGSSWRIRANGERYDGVKRPPKELSKRQREALELKRPKPSENFYRLAALSREWEKQHAFVAA